jgi:hypothetical protein
LSKNLSDKNLLASLAVFRGLEEKGKSTNEIITEFLVDIIKTQKLYSFSVAELNSFLNGIYDFQIPDAVIAVALKGITFLKKENQIYSIQDRSKLSEYDLETEKNNRLKDFEVIFTMLCKFIEDKNQKSLDENEKKRIEHAFANYILDNKIDNGYSDSISMFIINNKHDEMFMNNLKTIKEGVIIYTGLKYNPNFKTDRTWNTKLVIYLNMEIIFHFGGYNGSLFKTLFDDLYKLIKEINSQKKYIYLRYLPETKNEIRSFFYSAEGVVSGISGMIAGNTAMRNIVNGCNDRFDVIAKREQLFELLRNSGILEEEEETDVYDQENYKYNVITSSLLEKFSSKIDKEDINDTMQKLNYISIKRGARKQNNFENIGYILLTEVGKINSLAWDDSFKSQGQVPLATNLQFLTNKLWFKLNKGFGDGDYPISFNLTTKAQVLLSSHIGEKLHDSYLELHEKVHSGQMSKDVALKVLYELKSRSKLPEEIYDADMSSVMSTLEETLEGYVLEHENALQQAQLTSKEYEKLQKEIAQIAEEKNKIKEESHNLSEEYTSLQELFSVVNSEKENKEKEADYYKEKYIEEQRSKAKELKEKIDQCDRDAESVLFREELLGYSALTSLLIYLAIYHIDWDSFEKWAWVISIIFSLTVIFFGKRIQPIKNFIENRKSSILDNIYRKKQISIEEYQNLESLIREL